jgi:hypothetical protein
MKMKNIKRSLSLLLIAAMILSSISVLSADTTAAKFTDINNSWAKQNIINVYNKGLMNGVSETSFKPLDKVTNFQALISITRMTNAKQKYDLAALEAKYKDSVLDKYKVPSYARQETAYCIEAGILTANDISALTATTYATKQVVSSYLGKAFGITYDPTKPIVFLGYSDSMFIVKENKPHISYLIDIGVLSSKGDTKGNFNPDELISREIYAKMLDVASDKYKEVNPTAPTTPTVPTTPTEPTTPTVPTTPTIPTTPADYTGKVEQVIIEYGVVVFQITEQNGTITKKNISVADDIKCIIDGAESSYYWKVKVGDKAEIYLNKDKKISKLVVDSRIKKVTGTVESIVVTDKLELNVNIKDAGSKKYYITEKTKIVKNKGIVKYDSLKPGDNVYITLDNDDATEINADSKVTTDSGIIESIIYTRTAAPKITMIGLDGKNKEYFIRKDLDPAYILIGNSTSVVYNLRPGMHVSVELENDEIVKLTALRTETNDKFAGTIKYINTSLKVITMSYFDALEQKEIEKRVAIGDSKIMNLEARFMSLDQLKAGDKIIVIGVDDINAINANMIILDK